MCSNQGFLLLDIKLPDLYKLMWISKKSGPSKTIHIEGAGRQR